MFLTKPDKSELDPSSREASEQAEKFKLAQANDPTLTHWRKLAERGSNAFMIADGILFKRNRTKCYQITSGFCVCPLSSEIKRCEQHTTA